MTMMAVQYAVLSSNDIWKGCFMCENAFCICNRKANTVEWSGNGEVES